MSLPNNVQTVSLETTALSNSPVIFAISNNNGLYFSLKSPQNISQFIPGKTSVFTLARGYHLILYPQANFAGTPAQVNGPVTAPLNLNDDNQVISFSIIPVVSNNDSSSGWT